MTKQNRPKDYGRIFSLRLYGPDMKRLLALRKKLEMPWQVVMRSCLKEKAEKEGIA